MEGKISPEDKSLLKQTEDRINDSIAIVNQMVGSIDAKKVESLRKAKGEINLEELIRDAAGKLKYFINGNHVDFGFGGVSPCVVLGNREALLAAVSNIVDNAVRYAPGGKYR